MPTTAETQYQQRTDRRSRAVAAKQQGVTDSKDRVERLKGQAKDNQRSIRFGAARSSAAGQRNQSRGGGAIAAAADVGMAAEQQGILQGKEDQRMVDEAIALTTGKEVEAEEYAAAQGTEESDYSEALAEGQTEANKAISGAQGFFNDNEEQAAREITAIIARIRVKNPKAANAMAAQYLNADGTYKSQNKGILGSWWD